MCHVAMKPLKIGDVQIDECRRCRGIWFDKGELAEVKDVVEPDLRWLDFGIWKEEALFHINDEPLKCPRCQKGAAEVTSRFIFTQAKHDIGGLCGGIRKAT